MELGAWPLVLSEPSEEAAGAGENVSGDIGDDDSDDTSDGDGVLGGVSMDGIGWSLKQADS